MTWGPEVPVQTYLVNANVLDVEQGRALGEQTVRIDGGRIAEVTSEKLATGNNVVINLRGRTLIPGLIDCHCHVLQSTSNLAALAAESPLYAAAKAFEIMHGMLQRGFTTVRDVGGADFGIARAVEERRVAGPRILYCGKALTATGGHGDYRAAGQYAQDESYWVPRISRLCEGVSALRSAVRDEVRKGAHHIKIMANGGVASPTDRITSDQYSEEEIRAVVDEAEMAGLYVASHTYTAHSIARAVRNGVRSIEHGNLADSETLGLMKSAGSYLVPTLIIFRGLAEEGVADGLPAALTGKLGDMFERGMGVVEEAHRIGIPMAFGSDLIGRMHRRQSEEFALRAGSGARGGSAAVGDDHGCASGAARGRARPGAAGISGRYDCSRRQPPGRHSPPGRPGTPVQAHSPERAGRQEHPGQLGAGGTQRPMLPAWTFGAAGDVFLNRPNWQQALEASSPVLRRIDLVFGNCEGAYTDSPQFAPSAGWRVVAPLHCGSRLAASGFDVMALANNHSLDAGHAGLADTMRLLREQGILTVGAGQDLTEARRPAIVERGGIRVGFLSFASVYQAGYDARHGSPGLSPMRIHSHYFIPDRDAYGKVEPGVRPQVRTFPFPEDMSVLRDSVASLRDEADVVIVSHHWGNAGEPALLTEYERVLGRATIDAGADIVVGHHHHFLRGVEIYKGKPIYYGLGHFVFDLPGLGESSTSAELTELKQMGDYAIYPREGYPLSPFHPDSRMTMIAVCSFEGARLRSFGFLPCMIDAENYARPLSEDLKKLGAWWTTWLPSAPRQGLKASTA